MKLKWRRSRWLQRRKKKAEDFDRVIRSVNHRGFSSEAPENTMPAYRLSKEKGFRYVEADVSFTSDGVPVLLHDATINRTSNGSGKLSEMTFAEVREFDFGAWKSPQYAGTRIPTLDEFLSYCRDNELLPYVELKKNGGYTEAQIREIVDAVEAHGLRGKASFISFSPIFLSYVRDYDPTARLGLLKSKPTEKDIPVLQRLRTPDNQVFYDVKYGNLSVDVIKAYKKERIPIEVWTVDDEEMIRGMHRYISGITSNETIAGKILYYAGLVTGRGK